MNKISAQTELWGMTMYGGTNNLGVIFKTDGSGNNFTVVYNFDSVNGGYPTSSLLLASDGNLYGFTSLGGLFNQGVMFQFNPITNVYTKKINLEQNSTGRGYKGAIEYNNGNLYGITPIGGSSGSGGVGGVILQYNLASSNYSLKDYNCGPTGELLKASDGELYGASNYCQMFKYDPFLNTVTNISYTVNPNWGTGNYSTLIQASDGKFYGSTFYGNYPCGCGDIYQYDITSGIYKSIHQFNIGGRSGSLCQASNSLLYGIARGGVNNNGVIYSYDTNLDIYTVQFNFEYTNSGNVNYGELFQASDGNLYGLIGGGGSDSLGVFYKFSPLTNIFTKILDFNGINGAHPTGEQLIEINITSIMEKDLINSFSVFPNPNNGSFSIELKTKSQVIILNSIGEVVFNKQMEIGKQKLLLQQETDGVYFVKVTNDKGWSSTKKIIIIN